MELRPWQEKIVRALQETREDGLLKYRRCLLLLPRKQAKTSLTAMLATHHILGTPKRGQSVLCAANSVDQACILYEKVMGIIEEDPYLKRQVKGIETSKKIIKTKSGNRLRVVSSDATLAHGENPSLAIIDEYWGAGSRLLIQALTSGYATRKEYLTLIMSTQGNHIDSPIYEEYEYAKKVQADPSINPEYLPIIYEAGPPSLDQNPDCQCDTPVKHNFNDWQCERTWFQAMPALGDFAELDYIRSEYRLAQHIPSEESKFKQFYLNILIAGEGKWLNKTKWDACAKYPIDLDALKGRRAYVGADLSAKSDISAIVLCFPMDTDPQTYQILPFAWIPKEYAKERDRKGYSTYKTHEKNGHITFTEGFYIDEDKIIEKIIELGKTYKIKKILFDEWSASRPATILETHGFKTNFMGNSNVKQNEPCKYLETLIATERLHHGNHPVLNIHADNCVINRDKHDNIRLDKQNSHEKIDLMSALVLAMAAAMVEKPKKTSVYETRGIISVG